MRTEEAICGEDSIPCAIGARTAGKHTASGECPGLSGAHPVPVRRYGMCLAVDLGGLSVIVAEMARSETQVTFHYPYMPPAQPAVQSDRKIRQLHVRRGHSAPYILGRR